MLGSPPTRGAHRHGQQHGCPPPRMRSRRVAPGCRMACGPPELRPARPNFARPARTSPGPPELRPARPNSRLRALNRAGLRRIAPARVGSRRIAENMIPSAASCSVGARRQRVTRLSEPRPGAPVDSRAICPRTARANRPRTGNTSGGVHSSAPPSLLAVPTVDRRGAALRPGSSPEPPKSRPRAGPLQPWQRPA
jgi:hypothetical protein